MRGLTPHGTFPETYFLKTRAHCTGSIELGRTFDDNDVVHAQILPQAVEKSVAAMLTLAPVPLFALGPRSKGPEDLPDAVVEPEVSAEAIFDWAENSCGGNVRYGTEKAVIVENLAQGAPLSATTVLTSAPAPTSTSQSLSRGPAGSRPNIQHHKSHESDRSFRSARSRWTLRRRGNPPRCRERHPQVYYNTGTRVQKCRWLSSSSIRQLFYFDSRCLGTRN